MAEETVIKCFTCKKEIVEGKSLDTKIKCSLCDNLFHISCLKISVTVQRFLSGNNNCIWACESCPKISDTFVEMLNRIKTLETTVQNLISESNENKNEIGEIKQNPALKLRRTYADMIMSETRTPPTSSASKKNKPNAPFIAVNTTPLIVVSARDETAKANIENLVKSTLDPDDDPIKRVTKTRKGNILVQCNNNNVLESIKKKLSDKIGDKINVAEPKKSSPLLKVVGITDVTDKEQLIQAIKKQNCDLVKQGDRLEVVDFKKVKNHYTAILSVDFGTFKSILDKGKLRIRWDMCRVYEHINVTRCYKCNDYGHHANECTQKEHTCPKCAGSHEIKLCNADYEKCSNCMMANEVNCLDLDVNHTVWNYNCPLLQRRLNIVKKRVRYTT